MSRFTIMAAVVISAVSPILLGAQRVGDLQHGARVRVLTIDGRSRVGFVELLTPDSLTIVNEHSGLTTARLDDVSRIDASTGTSHFAGAVRGGLKGLVAGAIVGGVGAGLFYHRPVGGCSIVCGRGAAMTIYGIVFGAGGLASGTLIGAAQGAEQWNPISRATNAMEH